jgi:hypothetical protein
MDLRNYLWIFQNGIATAIVERNAPARVIIGIAPQGRDFSLDGRLTHAETGQRFPLFDVSFPASIGVFGSLVAGRDIDFDVPVGAYTLSVVLPDNTPWGYMPLLVRSVSGGLSCGN